MLRKTEISNERRIELLTIRQTAARGPLSENALRRLNAEKRLPVVLVGNRSLVRYDELLNKIERGEL